MESVLITMYFIGLYIAANAIIAAVVIILVIALIISVKGEAWSTAVLDKHPEWAEEADVSLITIVRNRRK